MTVQPHPQVLPVQRDLRHGIRLLFLTSCRRASWCAAGATSGMPSNSADLRDDHVQRAVHAGRSLSPPACCVATAVQREGHRRQVGIERSWKKNTSNRSSVFQGSSGARNPGRGQIMKCSSQYSGFFPAVAWAWPSLPIWPISPPSAAGASISRPAGDIVPKRSVPTDGLATVVANREEADDWPIGAGHCTSIGEGRTLFRSIAPPAMAPPAAETLRSQDRRTAAAR